MNFVIFLNYISYLKFSLMFADVGASATHQAQGNKIPVLVYFITLFLAPKKCVLFCFFFGIFGVF